MAAILDLSATAPRSMSTCVAVRWMTVYWKLWCRPSTATPTRSPAAARQLRAPTTSGSRQTTFSTCLTISPCRTAVPHGFQYLGPFRPARGTEFYTRHDFLRAATANVLPANAHVEIPRIIWVLLHFGQYCSSSLVKLLLYDLPGVQWHPDE